MTNSINSSIRTASEHSSHVKLGIQITDYSYDADNEILYVEGPALESGVWSDSLGSTLFYPVDVIQESASLFKGCNLLCEHKGLPIGKVVNTKSNDEGFSLSGYITDKTSIDAVMSKRKLGFSIAASVIVNPVTLIVQKIDEIDHIALVGNPACKICGITSAHTNEGNIVMSKNKTDGTEVKVEESAEADVDVDAEPTITEDPIETEVKIEAEAKVDTSVVKSIEPTSIEIKADSIKIEQPLTEIMSALSTATDVVEKTSAQLSSAMTRLQEMENALGVAKIELSAKDTEIQKIKIEASGYQAKIDELQRQIDNRTADERKSIVASIMEIDPETNAELIEGMTNVQLGSYKTSIERLSAKGMIIGERKGSKIEEKADVDVVKVEASTEPKTEVKTKVEASKSKVINDSAFDLKTRASLFIHKLQCDADKSSV